MTFTKMKMATELKSLVVVWDNMTIRVINFKKMVVSEFKYIQSIKIDSFGTLDMVTNTNKPVRGFFDYRQERLEISD